MNRIVKLSSINKNILMAIILIIVISGAGLWTNHMKVEAKPAESELQTLIALGNQATESNIQVIVKWQGTWNIDSASKGAKTTSEAARALAKLLELPEVQQLEESGHIAYRVLDEQNDVNIRFNWEEISSTQSYVIVQFETQNDKSLAFMEQIQDEAGKQMNNFGIDAVWNGAAQGTVKGDGKATEVMHQVESQLLSTLSATRAETYEDVATVSNSYEVPSFAARVNSEGQWLNMQLAVHKISGSEDTRVTIGLPVITIEY